MIIRKIGKERWKHSGRMAWALRHYAEKEVDKIEWSIIRSEGETLDLMRVFKAEYSIKNRVVYRLQGRAILINSSITLIINERIAY